MSLFYSRKTDVEGTYIITVPNHAISQQLSRRCQESCAAVGMKYNVWEAFNGYGDITRIPDHSKNSEILRLIKLTDHYLTKTEVACFLSHLSLWIHCCLIDQPIVILEHDAVMIKKFDYHTAFNSIIYLGCVEWHKKTMPIMDIPVLGSDGPNYLFMLRAHAYSIDPIVAKNLIAHAIQMGIYRSLDTFIRADLFNITHRGLYAYNQDGKTTIINRDGESRSNIRNDDLKL